MTLILFPMSFPTKNPDVNAEMELVNGGANGICMTMETELMCHDDTLS